MRGFRGALDVVEAVNPPFTGADSSTGFGHQNEKLNSTPFVNYISMKEEKEKIER